jgi:hypothetical protein
MLRDNLGRVRSLWMKNPMTRAVATATAAASVGVKMPP